MELFTGEGMKTWSFFHTQLFGKIIKISVHSYQMVGNGREGGREEEVKGHCGFSAWQVGERGSENRETPLIVEMVRSSPSSFNRLQSSAQRASLTQQYLISRGGKSTGLLVRLSLRGPMQFPQDSHCCGELAQGLEGSDFCPTMPQFSSERSNSQVLKRQCKFEPPEAKIPRIPKKNQFALF